MVELQEPSEELKERLRRTVSANERLVGMRMSVMGGSNPTMLDSLVGAAHFLHIGTYEEAMRPNNQETIGYIDPMALERWVRGVFGDDELADAIKEQVDTGEAFGAIAHPIKELLQTRALQIAEEQTEEKTDDLTD